MNLHRTIDSLWRLMQAIALGTVILTFFASSAGAFTIGVTGRILGLSCAGGHYVCRMELTNRNKFVQHPSIYLKLHKMGLYGEKCVEFVEYIPELQAKSTDVYVIPLKTSCNVVVKPFFEVRLKRMKNDTWEKKMETWGEGCPPRRVVHAR